MICNHVCFLLDGEIFPSAQSQNLGPSFEIYPDFLLLFWKGKTSSLNKIR